MKKKEPIPVVETRVAEADSAYTADEAQEGPSGADTLAGHLKRGITSLAGALKSAKIKVDGMVVDITVNSEAFIAVDMKKTQIENLCNNLSCYRLESLEIAICLYDINNLGFEICQHGLCSL